MRVKFYHKAFIVLIISFFFAFFFRTGNQQDSSRRENLVHITEEQIRSFEQIKKRFKGIAGVRLSEIEDDVRCFFVLCTI